MQERKHAIGVGEVKRDEIVGEGRWWEQFEDTHKEKRMGRILPGKLPLA
jgi:hypothetical protein